MTATRVPHPAMLLGLSGLLPSLAMVAAMALVPDLRSAAMAIGLIYGALIASFAGGAWWGLAAARAEAAALPCILALSAVPSLIGWAALLIPRSSGLLLMAAVFAAMLPVDAALHRQGVAPGWWLSLRVPLSVGMAGLHAAAAAVLQLSGA